MYCLSSSLDCSPMQPELSGHILNRLGAAPSADQPGKAFGIKGIVRQPRQPLPLYLAALPAGHPPHQGPPGKCHTHRRTNPAPPGAFDRRNSDATVHRPHKPFFLAPVQRHDAYSRVPKEPTHPPRRNKARKPVGISQPMTTQLLSHPQIVTTFRAGRKRIGARQIGPGTYPSPRNSPTRLREEPFICCFLLPPPFVGGEICRCRATLQCDVPERFGPRIIWVALRLGPEAM